MTYETLIPRFLKYVQIETRSDETSDTIPSTQSQVAFLNQLAEELTGIGLDNVHINQQSGYLFATLPSNLDKPVKTLGFISHVDTADFNAKNVTPKIVENYDGHSVIPLDDAGEYKLDPAVFPSLKGYQGYTLITTDGSTLLGSDDKSGVAEIITAMSYLLQHPEIKHGTIQAGFGLMKKSVPALTSLTWLTLALTGPTPLTVGRSDSWNTRPLTRLTAGCTSRGRTCTPGVPRALW